MMNPDEILFRASSTSQLMTDGDGMITEKQLKTIEEYQAKPKLTDIQGAELRRLIDKRDNPELSLTTKNQLLKVYAKAEFDREEEVRSKYMDKGTRAEDDSITLYSLVKKKFFKKNEIRLNNRYVTGLPDLFDGPDDDIQNAEEIEDIKSSWSLNTFLAAKFANGVNKDYYWQGQSYLALIPKAKRFRLVYVLINTPAELIMDEKKKLLYKERYDETDPDYIEACKNIEKNHIFDMALFRSHYPYFEFHNDVWAWDIPKEKRYHEIVIERDPVAINALYERITMCRKWMKEKLL
jgi:hypothetical protein